MFTETKNPLRTAAPARLSGEAVWLRPVELEDCTATYVGWLADPQVNRYLETRWSTHDLDTVRQFVSAMRNDADNVLFAICEAEGGTHVGNIKLGPVNWIHRYADISYFIGDRSFWSRGLATDAIRTVTGFGFEVLKLHRLQAGVYRSNGASARALERVGYALEGTLRQKLRADSAWEDHLIYGITADQWTKKRGAR